MLLLPASVTTLDGVIAFFSKLTWKVIDLAGGGRSAFAVIGGDKSTGDIVVIACIEGGTTPLHVHPGGEVIHTWAGMLMFDAELGGALYELLPNTTMKLEPDSQHAPRADFWVGIYRQPKGSTLVA